MLKKSLAILLWLAGGVAAHAATLSYTAVNPPRANSIENYVEPTPPAWWSGGSRVFTVTDWDPLAAPSTVVNLSLQKFNPALGVLNSVTFSFRGATHTVVKAENRGSKEVKRGVWSVFSDMFFTLPASGQQTFGLSASGSLILPAYDGVWDYSGPSGFSGLVADAESNSGNPTTQTLLANFGPYTGIDTFTIPVSTFSGMSVSGGGGNQSTELKPRYPL